MHKRQKENQPFVPFLQFLTLNGYTVSDRMKGKTHKIDGKQLLIWQKSFRQKAEKQQYNTFITGKLNIKK